MTAAKEADGRSLPLYWILVPRGKVAQTRGTSAEQGPGHSPKYDAVRRMGLQGPLIRLPGILQDVRNVVLRGEAVLREVHVAVAVPADQSQGGQAPVRNGGERKPWRGVLSARPEAESHTPGAL